MKVNRRGIFGTIFTHGLVLALLILGGLTFPDPPPEEEGIMVNFGTDDTGFGFIEPKGDESNAGNPELEVAQAQPEFVEEAQPEPAPSDPVYEDPLPEDNTQDVEETPVKEDPQPTAEEIRKQKEEVARVKKEREDERIRKEEEDKILREQEAERIRLAEEARLKQENADRLSNMGKNTFGQQGVGEEEGSEGINPGSGTNQGVTTGTPDAPNYGDGSGLGNGISFGLGSRKAVGKVPTPNVDNCQVTSRIIVKVEIQVDRQGNVILASVSTSTFSDKCIYDAVVAAARKTKFTSDPNASYKQTGWIKYTIEP